MNKNQISRSHFMNSCRKPFLRKKAVKHLRASVWNFTDIDFLVWKENVPASVAAAVLWYNGNFSRDFYGSDFASSLVYCSFFSAHIYRMS
jgi:hypothetical protein